MKKCAVLMADYLELYAIPLRKDKVTCDQNICECGAFKKDCTLTVFSTTPF